MAALIAVDWGTTSFRACLLDPGGGIADRIETADGILAVPPGGFAARLEDLLAHWGEEGRRLPVVMSGMIGSRQGWLEVDYVRCPAAPASLSQGLRRVETAVDREVWIVPGLDVVDGNGRSDVMRGEETQVLGALALGAPPQGLCVLPGTHSKWVALRAGGIDTFRTYMTGEVFAALRGHTILGRLMSDEPASGAGFSEGVRDGAMTGTPGALLNRVFATRTSGLSGRLPPAELSDYLSGLLIGAELADAAPGGQTFTIIAGEVLAERYLRAGALIGLAARRAPPDCAAAGAWQIARAAGLMAPA